VKFGARVEVLGHLKILPSAFGVKWWIRGPGRVMARSPRTLKYSRNSQILDEGLEIQMEWLGTLWGAPVDVGRHRSPWRH